MASIGAALAPILVLVVAVGFGVFCLVDGPEPKRCATCRSRGG
jgi:hypothetical protein